MDNKKIAAVVSFLAFLSLVFYFSMVRYYFPDSNVPEPKIGAMIGSGICKIPDLHPNDSTVLPFVRSFSPPKCKHQVEFIQTNLDGTISFNDTAFRQEKIDPEAVRCFYQEIYRRNGTDNAVSRKPVKKLLKRERVSTDIVHVWCKSSVNAKSTFYEHFLPLYQKKKDAVSRVDREKPNILFIGSDSLSRLNCMRSLPKSYQYLEKNLKAHIFRLHVKCGLNTRPNMMAMLTGKRMFEHRSAGILFPAELNHTRNSFHDDWPFIWKDLEKRGYVSAIAENVPSLTMFNFKMKGFRYQPVDHYMRNFWLAWKLLKNERSKTKHSKEYCVMDTPMYTAQYQWILNIMRMYKDIPVFGLALDAFTHNHIGQFSIIDKPLRELLESLYKEQLLENTILFVFGDHGVRSGKYRETWMGRLEDNTPFFSIVLPEWIKDKYPHLDPVLSYNEDKLTTWYDVHATLDAIRKGDYGDFEEPKQPRTERGISLFRKISDDRTCLDASIPLQFCPCTEEMGLSASDRSAEESGQTMVKIINDKLKNHRNKCAILKLKSIKEATAIRIQDEKRPNRLSRKKKLKVGMRLIIETSPHGAIFETVMFYDKRKKKYYANQSIERLDEYGSQGDCVQDGVLGRYCHCI